MIRRVILSCSLICLSLPIFAQDGVGLWTSVEVTKRIKKGLNFSVEGEMRTTDNWENIDRWNIGASMSYRLNPYLRISGGYTFLYNYMPSRIKVDMHEPIGTDGGYYSVESKYYSPYWRNRHRFYIDVTGNYIWRRFTFSVRERYQYTRNMESSTQRVKSDLLYSTTYDDEIDGYPYIGSDVTGVDQRVWRGEGKNRLRSRIEVEYNIPKCKWDPFLQWEMTNYVDNHLTLQKMRWTVGVDYKLSKVHSFKLSYRFQHHFIDENQTNAFGVGYNYKF